MVAWEHLLDGFLLGVLIHFFHNLGIVLNNLGELALGQDILPEVIGHQAVRVRRIACTVLISLVEGQKPAGLFCQFCAELYRGVIHGEMHHAAFEGEKQVARIAIIHVLLDGIFCILLGQLIL